MNSSSSARPFAVVIALCFTVLLVSGIAGRDEDSLVSVFQQARADMAQQLVTLSRVGLPS